MYRELRDLKLRRVVSGGQTGVDQAALRAAIESGLSHGGWCPPGRSCESGDIPKGFALRETPEERSAQGPDIPRSLRTEWNVRDSDATLILRPAACEEDPGTKFTVACAKRLGRPFLVRDPDDSRSAATIRDWLRAYGIMILNVAGPSEQTSFGVGKQAHELLAACFEKAVKQTSKTGTRLPRSQV